MPLEPTKTYMKLVPDSFLSCDQEAKNIQAIKATTKKYLMTIGNIQMFS